jgi:phosphomannomutase
MTNLDLHPFHDYDVRGIYPSEINEDFFYALGKSIALYMKKGPIYVGHDTRLSSPSLTTKLIEGITDYGLDVVDLGNISTEMHNYACSHSDSYANVMVTASHNPPQYNGVKTALHGPIPLHSGYGLPEIKEFMNQDLPKAEHKGTVTKKDIFNEWVEHILKAFDLSKLKKLKIVVDAGNGMGGPVWQALLHKLPVEIIPMYLEPDGTFPHHVADPSKHENLQELIDRVKAEKADFGLATDGDADRAVFIDEHGEVVPGTVMTAVYCEYFLQKNHGGTCLYDATCGRIVPETIQRNGGTGVRTRVGHSFIKTEFKKVNGIFAGENSGHFYFEANGGSESSAMAAVLLMEIMSEKNKKLSEIRKEFDIYPRSGEVNFKTDKSKEIITDLLNHYKQEADSVDELDGTSVWFKDWWFNIRLSKTEPLMRLNVEANTKDLLDTHFTDIVAVIEKHGGVRK